MKGSVHAIDPIFQEAEVDLYKLKASLTYIMKSRIARATQTLSQKNKHNN